MARLFGNCYRVAFYGPAWGEQAGKEYIYREGETTRLADISNRLKVFSSQVQLNLLIEPISYINSEPIQQRIRCAKGGGTQ